MTVKQKRAEALRKVSREEAAAGYEKGGFVDDSFPETAVREALGDVVGRLEWPAFAGFLGDRLGLFRATSEPLPKPSEERVLAEELLEVIRQLQRRLDNLPPRLESNILLHCHRRHRTMFHVFRQNLDKDLSEAWNLISLAERDLPEGDSGRKEDRARDWLLAAVAAYLERAGIKGKTKVADLAGDVLAACGIGVPADPKERRERVKRCEREGIQSP